MKHKMRCYAACSFGLEAAVAFELKNMGFENVTTRDARVYFDADDTELAKANLWLRTADRVYVVIKEFEAYTFDELYEGINHIAWQDYLPKEAAFPVLADAVRSMLGSVSDVQAITKKAIVDALRNHYGSSFFKEAGAKHQVYVNILSDMVTVSLNASGAGLNRRGYRVKTSTAPLRETLAAGMIHISRWSDRPFYDPLCGSGTIVIEAALKAQNRAPGLKRKFDAQFWNEELTAAFESERELANAAVIQKPEVMLFASDIDEKMIELTEFHAKRAGVAHLINIQRADATKFVPKTEQGTLISNPPYAVRMGEADECHRLYTALGRQLKEAEGLRYYFISSDESFEKYFGKKADKKRKLYNGNLKCTYYQYFRF